MALSHNIMNEERIDVNEVIVQGPIVFKNKNDVATNFKIKVARGNLPVSAKEDTVCYNWADVAIYDPLLKVQAEAFNVGDEVMIKAFVNVTHKLSKITGKMFYDQKLVATSIEKAHSVFDGEEAFDCPTFCKFRLDGTITNIRMNGNIVEFNVRTITHKHVNNIQTSLFCKDPEKVAGNFMIGERVHVVGNLQTPRKVIDGETISRKNYVISRITKISEDKENKEE